MVSTLTSSPFLGGYSGDFGGTTLVEEAEMTIVAVSIPLGEEEAIAKATKTAFGCDLPGMGHSVQAKKNAKRLARWADDQVLVLNRGDDADAVAPVRKAMKDNGYFVDQTHNLVALSMDGTLARAALERICGLNLHADAYAVDAAHRTVMEHMGAMIIRTGDDKFLLISASSSAGSFLHALEQSLNYVMD